MLPSMNLDVEAPAQKRMVACGCCFQNHPKPKAQGQARQLWRSGPLRCRPKNNQQWASLPLNGNGYVRSDDINKLTKKDKENPLSGPSLKGSALGEVLLGCLLLHSPLAGEHRVGRSQKNAPMRPSTNLGERCPMRS